MTHRSPYAYYLGNNDRFKKGKLYHLLILFTDIITVMYCDTTLKYKDEDELLKDWEIKK